MNEIDICNKAILRVGGRMLEQGSGNLASDSTISLESKICKLNYDLIRDIVTADRVWSFALESVILNTPDAVDPVFGYGFRFQIPSDSVNVWRVYYSASNALNANIQGLTQQQAAMPWVVQGNYILANSEEIYVQYLRRLDRDGDLDLMSAGFIDTLSLRLAVELAIPIAQNNTLFAALNSEYEFRKLNSYAVNGSQAAHEVFVANQLSRCR